MEKTLGKQIREERIRRKLTQEELAAKLGYSRSNVSHWENDNAVPDETVFAIAMIGMFAKIANLNAQLREVAMGNIEKYSLEWHLLEDKYREDAAYITLTITPGPVKVRFDAEEAQADAWFYSVIIKETNGIEFTVDEIIFRDYYDDTVRNFRSWGSDDLKKMWGNNIIPASDMRLFRGGVTVQRITNSGVLLRGTDADGNELEFRGVINYSLERAD